MGGKTIRSLVILLATCVVGSCAVQHDERPGASGATSTAASSPTQSSATAAATATEPISLHASTPEQGPASTIIRGTGKVIAPSVPPRNPATTSQGGDVTLNFLNADVRDVIKAVLGDMLKLNYDVVSGVQGTVTIQTNRPIPRDAVFPALEQALRLAGLAIVKSGDVYKVMPVGEAPRQNVAQGVGTVQAMQPGYGVEIIPLQYANASELQNVLEPIIPNGSILRVDAARNLLIIAGTEDERQLIRSDIGLFDVDWLAGQSFAIFMLKSVDAKTIAGELTKVLGPLTGMVQLIPLSRTNGLLAISSQPKYLEELRTWVDRLDRSSEAADQQIYVYYVQNGRASDVASVLTNVLGGGNGGASSGQAPSGASPFSSSSAALGASSAESSSRSYGSTTAAPGSAPSGPPMISAPAPSAALQQTPSSGSITVASAGPAENAGPSAFSDVHITADDNNNALLILATPAEYGVIEKALRELDIAPLQILLDAAVAEVTLTNQLQYGLQYYFKSANHQIVNTNSATSAVAPTFPGFAYLFSTGSDISVVLNALANVTDLKVLSAPKVLVVNNQVATLQIGDEVPVPIQSAVSIETPNAPIVNSIEFKDTGVILKVLPRVNQDGEVQMDIDQEVSDVGPTTSSSLNAPTISQRKISSTVAVQDGQTIALGGLIKDSRTNGKSGIPFLQDIPVVGTLFGTTTDNDVRTELLVLITPHVVQGVARAHDITEELRREMPKTRQVFDFGK